MSRTAASPGTPNVFRLLFCFAFMMASSGCKVIIEKRRYFKGYYVHFPLGNKSAPLKPRRIFPVADTLPPFTRDTSGFYAVTEDRVDTSAQPAATAIVMRPDSAPPFTYVRLSTNTPAGRDTMPFFFAQPSSFPPPVISSGTSATPNASPSQDEFMLTPPVLRRLPFASPDTVDRITFVNDTLRADSLQTLAFIPEALRADSLEHLSLLDTIAFIPQDTPKPRRKKNYPEVLPSVYAQAGLSGFQVSTTYAVMPHSFSNGFGLRLETPLKGRSSAIADLGYRANRFFISGSRPKAAPLPSETHDKERLTMNMLSGGIAVRLHFKEKEETPEQFIDLGSYADWTFRTANVYVDERTDNDSPIGTNFHVKTKITGLPYLNKTNWGVTARYARGNFSVFAMYRVSDLVKRNSPEKRDLPRVVIGVEVFTR